MPTGPEGSLAIQAGPGAAAPWADAAQVSLLACWTLQSSNRTDLKNSVRCEPVGWSGRRSALEQNQVKVREGVRPRGQSRPPDTAQAQARRAAGTSVFSCVPCPLLRSRISP